MADPLQQLRPKAPSITTAARGAGTVPKPRRVSPSLYKLLLTAHIIVSVGWLGIVFAKLVLGLAAVTSDAPDVAAALYVSMDVVNVAFPPVAIGTIVTGVLLSLGTKWGLLHYYWVATKIVLTVGVITTAVQLGDRYVRQAIAAPSGQAVDGGTILGIASAPTTLLIPLAVAHVFMLGAATVISVYKPWGTTWFGRRVAGRPTVRASAIEATRRDRRSLTAPAGPKDPPTLRNTRHFRFVESLWRTPTMTYLLWIIQALLALVFLFTGGMKLLLPIEELTAQGPLPGPFVRFLGVAEVLGALGLVLPGLLRIRPGLTPLAAAGLVIIMIGATVLTPMMMDAVLALIPLVVGLLAAFVAYGRWRLAPLRGSSRPSVPQPTS